MPEMPYTKQPRVPRRLRDKNAIELRITARGRDVEAARQAKAELERRVGNLKGAVIPAWELRTRGPIPAQWELV